MTFMALKPLEASSPLLAALLKQQQESCSVDRCEHVTVKFQQRDLETANDWDTLTPGNTAEYAWDEPMAAHRLRVVLESATEAFRDAPVQEYNLDDIKVTYPSHTQAYLLGLVSSSLLVCWLDSLSSRVLCGLHWYALLAGRAVSTRTSELLPRWVVFGKNMTECYMLPSSAWDIQLISACTGSSQGAIGASPLQDSSKGGQCGACD